MKKFVLLLTALVAMGLSNVWAYDFSAVAPSGQTLYYNIVDGNAEVTSQNSSDPYYSTYPTGALVIPASVTYNGTTYLVTTIGNDAFCMCSGLTSVNIPNSVTNIGEFAFFRCSGLTSLDIPNSLTSISQGAFQRCEGLISVVIPNSVTSIGFAAFWNCNSLSDVTIPNSVTTIGGEAFGACSGLTSVTIGNSVTSIGDRAFSSCSGLTSVNYLGTVAQWCNIDFGGASANPTYFTQGLSISGTLVDSLVIPEGVETIKKYSFYSCSGLTSVTIPNSVTSIGSYAFAGCSGLTEITSEARTAPLLETNAFSGVNIQIPVNIPCGSMASYMSRWSYFSNFVEDEGFSFEATSNDPAMGSVNVLTQPTCENPHAVVYAVANDGYRFARWNNGATDNPYAFDLTSDTVLVAVFEPASSEGVEDVITDNYSIRTRGGMIMVKDAEGEMLRIFDIQGRTIVCEQAVEGKAYTMPNTGVYMVKVGNCPAQKVVVAR